MKQFFSLIDRILDISDRNIDIVTKFRFRFIAALCLCTISSIIITSIPKWYFIHQFQILDLFSLTVCAVFGLVLYGLPNKFYVKVYRFTLLGLVLVLIPMFTYFLKSNSWSLIPWVFILFKCVRLEFGLRNASFILIYCLVACICGMYFIGHLDPVIPHLGVRIFVNFVPVSIVFIAMEYFESMFQLEMIKELRSSEKKKTINNMVKTINHEINNPLTVSLSSLNLYKKEVPEDNIHLIRCERGLRTIEKVISNVSRKTNFKEKVYSQHSTMFDLSLDHEDELK